MTLASPRAPAVLVLFLLAGCAGAGDDLAAATPRALLESPVSAADCPPGTHVIEGTDGDDVLIGTSGPDCILGHGGNDLIHGFQGDDILAGGDGNDVLEGGAGDDQLFGGGGDDVLAGGTGSDVLMGGGGDDALFGQQGSDVLLGGDGADTLDGATGDDQLLGDAGDDQLHGGPGADHLAGGDGDDVLDGGDADDLLDGGGGDDQLAGGGGDDLVAGGDGDDVLAGDGGDDLLLGGAGNDSSAGGSGADVLLGGAGNDVLDGGGGPDAVHGDDGDDLIATGPDDEIDGGSGHDACSGAGCEDGGAPVTGCVDDAACPAGQRCDVNTGICLGCLDAGECDDGLFCNGAETCAPLHGCQAGEVVSCDDGVACTTEVCDEDADQCVVDDAACGVHLSEVQITAVPDIAARPKLAEDEVGRYVVYAVGPVGGMRRIELQRLDADGRPAGPPQPLSDGLTYDEEPDAHGGRVVWTRHADHLTPEGSVVVHDLATGEETLLDAGARVAHARIHGDHVVWVGYDGEQHTIRVCDLAAVAPSPVTLYDQNLGAHPHLDIGSRLIVWEERLIVGVDPDGEPVYSETSTILVAYDLLVGARLMVSSDFSDRQEPSSSGNRVAMRNAERRVEILETSSGSWQTVYTAPSLSYDTPSLGSELLATVVEHEVGFSVEIVDVATGESAIAGTPNGHELAPDVLGRDVVYLSNRDHVNDASQQYDIFLASLSPSL